MTRAVARVDDLVSKNVADTTKITDLMVVNDQKLKVKWTIFFNKKNDILIV
jgi:hypothetical protein